MNYPELTLQAIDEQVTAAAREGHIITRPYAVTPEVAAQVLAQRIPPSRAGSGQATQAGERRARQVRELAASMRDGTWKPCASVITFSRDGRLSDGLLRLRAIAEAGTPVVLVADFGDVPPRLFPRYLL
jgi:hypothetical protein